MKVKKLEAHIRIKSVSLKELPNIHVKLGGSVTVTLDNGKEYIDNNLLLKNNSEFFHEDLVEEQQNEIRNQINGDLSEIAEEICCDIYNIEKTKFINKN